MRIEAFLPSRHGFPSVVPPVEGDDFGLATSLTGAFGLSAGMAWTALDRYLAGRPLPALQASTGPDDLLRAMLRRRQDQALARAGWQTLREWQALPERGVPGRAGLAERSRTEFRQLRRSLDDGVPVMLYLVLAEGRHADPSRNQAVLAYGYEVDRRARRASIRVYDPARPGNDGLRLVFQTSAGRALDARLAVQTPVRGFFCVPYDRPLPARIALNGIGADEARIDTVLAVRGQSTEGAAEALVRATRGGLLHVRRRRSGGYAAEPIDCDVLEGCEVESAVFSGAGRLVLWSTRGELIECRRRPGLGWRGRRITDPRTHGRIDGITGVVPRERGRVSLFACGSGRLLQFRRGRLPGWEAEHVDAGPLARAACTGSPAGVRLGSAIHVVARTRTGEVVHAHWRGRRGWVAENVTARAGDRERFLVVDDPILLADSRGRALSAVARTKTGAVVLFRWTERKGWRALDLSTAAAPGARDALRSDSPVSAAVERDGTVHAVGRTPDGGLLHAWCTRSGAVGIHELTRSRPLVGDAGRVEGRPAVAAGPADAVHILACRDGDLLLFRWAEHADWSVENVTAERERPRVAQDPLLSVAEDVLHVGLVDADGRMQHLALQPAGGRRRLHVPGIVVDVVLLPLTITGLLADAIGALVGGARRRAAPAAGQARLDAPPAVAPQPAPAQVLPRLRDESEDAPAEPLPLLEESPASVQQDAPTAATQGDGIAHDDWNWDTPPSDPNRDLFDGPLADLLSTSSGQGVPAVTSAPPDGADAGGLIDLSVILPASGHGPAGAGRSEPAADPPAPAADQERTPEGTGEAPEPAADALPAEEAVALEPVLAALPAEEAVVPESGADPAGTEDAARVEPIAAASAAEEAVMPEPGADAGLAEEAGAPEPVADARAADEAVAQASASGQPSAAADEPQRPASSETGRRADDLIVVYPEPESAKGRRAKKNGKPAPVSPNGNGSAERGKPESNGKPTPPARGRIAFPPEFEPAPDTDEGTGAEAIEPLPLLGDDVPDDAASPGLPRFDARDTDDWNAPALPVAGADDGLPGVAGSGSRIGGDDDWNLPPDVVAGEAAPAAADDWNLPPADAPPAQETPAAMDAGSASPLEAADDPAASGSTGDLVPPTVEGLQQQDDAGSVGPSDGWQLPAVEGFESSAATPLEAPEPWAVTPVEGLETEEATAGAGDGDSNGASEDRTTMADGTSASADADRTNTAAVDDALATNGTARAGTDDWNLAPDEPAVLPQPVTGTAEPELPTLEPSPAEPEPQASDEAQPVARRKWNNPALEGLPLLDDEDATPPRDPLPSPASAKPAARKKPKKNSTDDIERLIALADANRPELLPPD